MAERRLSILIALASRERAEDLAVHLAEEHGMVATLAGELDPEDHAVEHYDAVLVDRAGRRRNPARHPR